MGNLPVASLGGVNLSGQDLISWGLQTGSQPFTTTLNLTKDRAERVLAQAGRPLVLQLGPARFDGVFALHAMPTLNPSTLGVFIADRRWLWGRAHITVDFNMRRRTGETRLNGPRPETADLIPDIKYAPHSLRNGTGVWTPRQMIKEVMDRIFDNDPGFPHRGLVIFGIPDNLELENIHLDDPGDVAITKLLGQIPGATLALNRDGTVVVYSVASRLEQFLLENLQKRAQVGGGLPQEVKRAAVRPSAVEVLYTADMEVKATYLEQETSTSDSYQGQITNTSTYPFQLDNVLPCPDYELTLADGRKVQHGTWITVQEAVTAWAALPKPPAAAGNIQTLSVAVLRQHFLNSLEKLRFQYLIAASQVDAEWEARLSTLLKCYRQFFRLRKSFRDRCQQWELIRANQIDRATGMRQASTVFCDYVVRPAWKVWAGGPEKSKRIEQGWAIRGAATNLTSGDAKPSPFIPEMIDREAFVFRIIPITDPWGYGAKVAPGWIDQSRLPRVNPGEFNLTGNLYHALWEHQVLEAGWQMGIVLTVVPSHPNDTSRLTKIVIPAEVAGKALGRDLGQCNAPPVQLRVNPGVVTARYWWADEFQSGIINRFANGVQAVATLQNLGELHAYARALAARYYETMLDQLETFGPLEVNINQQLQPIGRTTAVVHTLEPTGRLVTNVITPGPPQIIDVWPLLPDSVRRIMTRVVNLES